MPTNLQIFIRDFKQAEQTVADFKEAIKTHVLSQQIKSHTLKMFLRAYTQSEDADVALAAKIASLINDGWLTLDAGDKLPDNWTENFDSVSDDTAQLHFVQRIGNNYSGQTLYVQFKDDTLRLISYMDGFAMTTPKPKGKNND